MSDPYERLPEDDEAPEALLQDFKDYMVAAVPGWQPDDAAIEVAMGAAFADEGSTLYALLREETDDRYASWGEEILGVHAGDAAPAAAVTEWVAGDLDGHTIDAGQTLVIAGFGFEVLAETEIPAGQDTASGVEVQALDPGAETNGAESPVEFDEHPAWVDTVTVTSPAQGGSDGDTAEEHIARVRGEASLLSRAPIQAEDYETVAREEPEIARALVRDNYDDTTGLDDQDMVLSIYPIDRDGLDVPAATKTSLAARYADRCIVNTIVRIADPTRTAVDVELDVKALEGYGLADLADRIQQAIAEQNLNPAVHGMPLTAAKTSWRQRDKIRQYDVAVVVRAVEGLDYIDGPILIEGLDADFQLPGAAPLPMPGTITVNVS